MRRTTCFAALLLLVGAGSARADWSEFWHRVQLDFYRVNCWPEPFQQTDRELAKSPLIAMTNAGWKLQNTLSHHFFDPETNHLTPAGELKVHWIVTQAPRHRRMVYVLRAHEEDVTSDRVQSVEKAVQRYARHVDVQPRVMTTGTVPVGGAGDYYDQVDRQLKSSIPQPRLPDRTKSDAG